MSFILVFVLLDYSFDVYVVSGQSMENTLYNGDLVLVKKQYTLEDKDIVVCDTTEMFLNEKAIIKRYYAIKSMSGLFLLGYNADNSLDSRQLGEFTKHSCKGVAVIGLSIRYGIKLL